jgi:hypothetical protein
MNAYAATDENFTRRMEEILASAEGEFREAIAYVDRVVIPEVRRESAGALRELAVHMVRLADWIDPASANSYPRQGL